jgi:hypothetical protein
MKSAEAFIEALEQGLSPVDALYSLPDYEPHYIDRIPVEVYRAALRNGWRFFPVSPRAHFAVTHASPPGHKQFAAVEALGAAACKLGSRHRAQLRCFCFQS